MSFVKLKTGINMHYRDCGEGKTILFVPGYAANVDTWNMQIMHLADKYRCVCVDLRGHGETDKPASEYTYDEMCGDVEAFLEAMDLKDVTMVCWSMGSGVGLKYVSDWNKDGRVTKILMAGACTPCYVQTPTEPYGMTPEAGEAYIAAQTANPIETQYAGYPNIFYHKDWTNTIKWFADLSLKTPAYVTVKYLKTAVYSDLRENLSRVNIPVKLMHGRHDEACDYRWSEYMAEKLGCELVMFEESGHTLMVEEAVKFSEEVAKFVEE